MHPAIAQQVMFDGGIYGVPTMISFNFQIVHAASWEACGSTDADVPQSFPQLLSLSLIHLLTSGKAEIDNTLCTGCGVCEQLCKFDALHAPKED